LAFQTILYFNRKSERLLGYMLKNFFDFFFMIILVVGHANFEIAKFIYSF